ncbi:TonB family protein [Undibacterium sp. RuRC25W]|uniref:TonB family protein n=1 Tax=Undibacterium sp. RuRC25W TaxID=3413047 RepID=UPI003BF1AF31
MKKQLFYIRSPLVYMHKRIHSLLLRSAFCLIIAPTLVQPVSAQEVLKSSPASAVVDSSGAGDNGTDSPKKNDVTFDIKKTCAVPDYPEPAKRFGLHGDTILKLMIDKNGKIDSFELLRSSGWKMLDMTVMHAIVGCQVLPPGNWIPSARLVRYKWMFDPGYISPGLLDVSSCQPSETLRIADPKEYGSGLVVGVYISDKGKVVDAKVQWESDKEDLNTEALRIAKSCSYTPAENRGLRIGNAESIRFLAKAIEAK